MSRQTRQTARWALSWLAIFLAFACGCRLAAAGPREALEAGGVVNVAAVIDGDTLRLADGRELRLAGLNVPAPDLPWPGPPRAANDRAAAAATDVANAARQALAELADQRPLQIYYDERRNDRYGRLVAQAVVAPDVWLEAELLRRGLARVETTRDAAGAAADLLAVEAEARAARRGLWALAAYQVRDAANLQSWRDSFQIIAGRVAGTHKSPGRTWVEFAGEHGRALELAIPAAANRLFRAAKLEPAALVGSDVRVRGWLRWQDGPIIDVDHPAQIEIISQSTAADARKRRVR